MRRIFIIVSFMEWVIFTVLLMSLVDLTIQVALFIWMLCVVMGAVVMGSKKDEDKKTM